MSTFTSAIRTRVGPPLLWLPVVALAFAVPFTTVFRRSPFWIVLNVGALAALGGYVAWSYLAPSGLPRRVRWAAYALAACAAAAAVVTRHELRHGAALGGRVSMEGLAWATWLAVSVLGCFLAVAVLKDLLWLGAVAVRPALREGPARRRLAALAAAAACVLLVHGLHEALRVPRVVAVDVPVAGLPAALDGFRIVQVSDLHVGQTIGRGTVARVVGVINALDADAVAITGDLVDYRPRATAPKLAPLADLRSRHGTFFVTGNHEHAWGARACTRELRGLGVTVLENDSRALETAGGQVAVLGVLDPSARAGRDGGVRDVGAAARSAGKARGPRVLLAHQADASLVRAADRLGVDLVLAGHTHGGQVFPGHLLTARSHPTGPGLHRRGRVWVYTSRGTGYWGPMLRIGAPAEITLLRLRPAAVPTSPLTPAPPRLTVAAAEGRRPWTSPRSSTRRRTASPASPSTAPSATTPARR